MTGSRATIAILVTCALLWGGIVLMRSADNVSREVYEATVTQATVQSYARQQLIQLQPRSFAEDVELCGLLAQNSDGDVITRTVEVGDAGTCDIAYFNVRTLYPLATFHTHAAHNPRYDSEVPSTLDLQSDMAGQLDGYIATPGGRFWHVDWRTGVARQLCGEGCLPVDPNYRPCAALTPATEYDLQSLRVRERQAFRGC